MSAPAAAHGADAATWPVYRRLLGYSARYWPIAALAALGMAFDAGCLTLFTYIVRPMLDNLFVARDKATIFWLPIIIVVIFVVRGLATFVSDYGVARVGRSVVQTLRDEVFARYLRLPAAYFDREASGQLIARMTYTVEQVASASTDALKVMVVDGLMVLGMTGVMLYNSPPLALILFVMAPLVGIVVYHVGRRYRRISHRIQDSIGSVTGTVDEVVSGQREVKIYGGDASERERFQTVNAYNRRLNLKIAATNAMSNSLVQLIAAIAFALVVLLATRPYMLKHLTAGAFMSSVMAMMGLLPSLKRLTTVQANLQRGVAAAQDVFAIIDAEGERDGGSFAVARSRGEIELREVVLRYRDQAIPALRGVSLRCAPGTVTALVGRSGSGKSSLASLIPRFYEPGAGEVSLDGRPLNEYTLASLRDQIAWVGQQVVLFNDTIGRNIAYGALAAAPRERIEAAARAANAMDFIERLPQGLDSRTGEGGALLSGGQRQRIAIARALLKNAPILILDEATSALDTESERLIQDALARLMRERTVLVIAHRLSTIEHADQIAVLDDGRIVEIGTHAELLARSGHYAALHRLQFRDETEPGRSGLRIEA